MRTSNSKSTVKFVCLEAYTAAQEFPIGVECLDDSLNLNFMSFYTAQPSDTFADVRSFFVYSCETEHASNLACRQSDRDQFHKFNTRSRHRISIETL